MNTIYAPEAVTFERDTPRPPKPRVCFLAPTTWPLISGSKDIPVIGGAELQQSVIAPELARRGFDEPLADFGQVAILRREACCGAVTAEAREEPRVFAERVGDVELRDAAA